MPELPEVATVVNQLSKLIVGQTIQTVKILYKQSFQGNASLLKGAEIISVRRIGKMIVMELSNGLYIVVHLKMTGQIRIMNYESRIKNGNSNLLNKHTRVIITFQSGDQLFFNDQRKFGWCRIMHNKPITNYPITQLK